MSELDDAFGFNDKLTRKANEEKISTPEKGLGDNAAEKVISFVAYLTLILGCLGSLIAGINMMNNCSTEGIGVGVLFGGILSSIITWAFLMVIANISNNIRQIKYELRKQNEKK